MSQSDAKGYIPRLGSWARARGFVGIVADADAESVTLFDPGARQLTEVPRHEAAVVPTGAVTVSVRMDVPIPHGLPEETLRRWLASLADDRLRRQAGSALRDAGIDEGAALPPVRFDAEAATTSGAVCLCGTRTPAPEGGKVACRACGREAVARPPGAAGAAGDVVGLFEPAEDEDPDAPHGDHDEPDPAHGEDDGPG